MARPRRDIERRNITMSKDVLAQIDLYLLDPKTNKNRYSAFSNITELLWVQLIRKLQTPGVDPRVVLRALGLKTSDLEDAAPSPTPATTDDQLGADS